MAMAPSPWLKFISAARSTRWPLATSPLAWMEAAAVSRSADPQEKRGAAGSPFFLSPWYRNQMTTESGRRLRALSALRFQFRVDIHISPRSLDLPLPYFEARLAERERMISGRNFNFGWRIADKTSVQRNVRIRGYRGDRNLACDCRCC